MKKVMWGLLLVWIGLAPVRVYSDAVVSVVRSDYSDLTSPMPPDTELSQKQIEMLVRKSVDLLGGMGTFVPPDTRWVMIKPNIVRTSAPGSGDITDSRVVWAVVKMVYEVAPGARITVAEGSPGWVDPKQAGAKEVIENIPWLEQADGFQKAGFKDMLKDPELKDARIDFLDLNFDEPVLKKGAATGDEYWIPKSVLDCDVFIDVPVLKVTNIIGLTNAMKNMVGIAPGLKYGWSKSEGYPPYSGDPGLPNHRSGLFDEMIVDLVSLSRIDLVVVDALVGMERGRIQEHGGYPIRMNTILVGSDPVAVDAISVRVMGMNPDDFECITLADRLGIGIGDLSRISVEGQSPEQVTKRFEKKSRRDERGHYGQSNRIWLVKGVFNTAHERRWHPDPKTLRPQPGTDGWSDPVYFSDDKINLKAYFDQPKNCVSYAYAEFEAPRTQRADLWLGSDEALTVWLNGDQVYQYRGSRRHRLPNDIVPVSIKQGRNRVLVEVFQTRREYGFSLNVCEPESDERYDGNRVLGLKFLLPEVEDAQRVAAVVEGSNIVEEMAGEPFVFNGMDVDPCQVSPKPEAQIEGIPRQGDQGTDYMESLQAVLSYKGENVSVDHLMGVSGDAFRIYYSADASPWLSRNVYPEDLLGVACAALGYTYACGYNMPPDSSVAWLEGWISGGYPVLACVSQEMPSWGIITGYEDSCKVLWVRTREAHTKIDGERHWSGWWIGRGNSFWTHRPMFVVGDRKEPPPPREVIRASLEKAVAMAHKDTLIVSSFWGEQEMYGGLRAYEELLEDLGSQGEQLGRRRRARGQRRRGMGMLKEYYLETLTRCRRAASVYLKSAADHFEGPEKAAMEKAAACYQKAFRHLKEAQKALPSGDRRERAVDPKEWPDLKKQMDRARQAIQQAYDQERTAVAFLEKVLQLSGR